MRRFLLMIILPALLLSVPVYAGGSREADPEESATEADLQEDVSGEAASDNGSNAGTIEDSKIVQIHYEGTLSDGSVFDSSAGREPLEFMFGVGMVIPGLEDGLRGMSVGESADIEVGYLDAYGPYREEGLVEYPREQIDPSIPLEPGMMLQGQSPQGPIPVTVVSVAEDTVLLDFNHPFAGEDLYFRVEVISVRDATQEEMEMIFGGAFPQGQ